MTSEMVQASGGRPAAPHYPHSDSDSAVGKETLSVSPGKTVRVSPAVDVEAAPQQAAIVTSVK